jgi:hypothetical protein
MFVDMLLLDLVLQEQRRQGRHDWTSMERQPTVTGEVAWRLCDRKAIRLTPMTTSAST